MIATNIPIIVLGLLLGMRHATDPDHVIAISTIVSRQRTALGAMVIGILWGIGHTITIMPVGGVIILFGVVTTLTRTGMGPGPTATPKRPRRSRGRIACSADWGSTRRYAR